MNYENIIGDLKQQVDFCAPAVENNKKLLKIIKRKEEIIQQKNKKLGKMARSIQHKEKVLEDACILAENQLMAVVLENAKYLSFKENKRIEHAIL